jgi:hypothetical protein
VPVCLLIATRGRREQLLKNLGTTLKNATRSDTEVVVILDNDDPVDFSVQSLDGDYWFWPRIKIVSGPRDDTLGGKYNRGFQSAPYSDLYVPFVDTVGIETRGWDERLHTAAKEFRDGIGAVFFGEQESPILLPQMVSITRRFIELQGFFLPPYFSFWWHDTWINEVALLTRRINYADIELTPLPADKKTRGAREITFWAQAYYELRHERAEIAERIIRASDFPKWQKRAILYEMPYWLRQYNEREAQTTRNPQWANAYESQASFDAPADERYNRVRRAMVERVPKLVNFGKAERQRAPVYGG